MRYLALPLLAVLAACAGSSEQPEMQGVNRTIDVTREADGTYKAHAPKCPKWDDETLTRYSNDPMPQLGCATAGNLAKMIADPADLVRDKTKADKPVNGDAERLSRGARDYRTDKTIILTAPSTAAQ